MSLLTINKKQLIMYNAYIFKSKKSKEIHFVPFAKHDLILEVFSNAHTPQFEFRLCEFA